MNFVAQGAVSSQANLIITVGTVIWLAALAGWAVHDRVKHRRTRALVLIGAGAATALVEATATHLMDIRYFPSADSLIVYSAFGRDISLWVVLMYPAWVGGVSYLVGVAADRGWTGSRLWRVYLAALLFDIAAEIGMVQVGFYSYEGSQPAQVFGVPFAWPVVFTSTLMAFVLAARQFLARTRGAAQLLVVLATPGILLGGVCLLGWPMLLGAGMNLDTATMSALGVVSTAVALLSSHALFRLPAAPRTEGASLRWGAQVVPPLA